MAVFRAGHPAEVRILTVVLAALLGFMPCAMAAAAAEDRSVVEIEEGVPGGVVVTTLEVSAEVVTIDYFNRNVTLRKPDGETITVNVGPEAVNFDQVVAGDVVKVTIAEEMMVHLDESGAAVGGSAAVATLGAQAGGMVAAIQEIIATVIAINHEERTATLQFQDGSTKTFPVREDIDLSKRQPGEQVVFRFTEMVAVQIEKS